GERVLAPTQPLEVDRPRQPRERGRAAGRQPARSEAGRGELRERASRRRILAAGPDDRPLDGQRLPRLDELTRHRAKNGGGDGRLARGPHPAEPPPARAEKWVVGESPLELR